MSEAPSFWWSQHSVVAWALAPLSFAYGGFTGWRMGNKPGAVSKVPVLCIGNFIAGGAGKTPTALALARAAKKSGMKPGFLTRGYGGGISHATMVDVKKHNSHDVGDEPLLLAARFPTAVSPDRPRGARLLEENGVNFIIMDDGFQNPSLHKDYSLVVVDARRGIGNGFAMPGGPLRANLGPQLALASAVLVIGRATGADAVIRAAARRAKPVYEAAIKPLKPRSWKGREVFAFAGIADPDKFIVSLEQTGAIVKASRKFGDHHSLTPDEVDEITYLASTKQLEVVTTSKDAARLKGLGRSHERLLKMVKVFDIDLVFENPQIPARIIEETIRRAKSFRLGL